VALPHRQQAAATVGQEPDVEQVESLAYPRQVDLRDLVGLVGLGLIGRDPDPAWLTLSRNSDAHGAAHR
jgi:hypothetical protein